MKKKISLAIILIASLHLFASSESVSKAFEVSVTGQGPSMFLIPGATCHASVWNATIERYKETYTIHTFTLAGYAGATPLSSDAILPVIKKELQDYIKANASENSVLIGHSIGGFLSMWLASESSKLVNRIVIVDALPFFAGISDSTMTQERAAQQFSNYKNYYTKLDSTAFYQANKFALIGMMKNYDNLEFVLNQSVKSDPKSMGTTMYEMLSNDLRVQIKAIDVPTLVLTDWDNDASYSSSFTLDRKIDAYAKQYAACTTCKLQIVENSKHFIMLDNASEFYKQVDLFLAK